MSDTMRTAFLADAEGIGQRHARLLRPGPRRTVIACLIVAAMLLAYLASAVLLDLSPLRILRGLDRLTDLFVLMWPPLPASQARFLLYLDALGQTVAIAFLGTLTAAVLAMPVGFIAARNVVANRIVHLLSRRLLDGVRSIDTLIWALIWINVVGLGPFAGALAIACSDFGTFGKLMSEAIETADRKAVDGITAAGGTGLAAIRFGILPQVLPVFASQVLYYFESNTRSSTIIGIVGAGGIGLHLSEMIRTLEWGEAASIILMILALVAVIDVISTRIRRAIIGRAPLPVT